MFTKITGVLVIDGEEQVNANLEIGVFDQDGICREARIPTLFPRTGKYIYSLQIRGNDGFVYTFKVYDHETESELDLVCEVVDDNGDPITYMGNYTYQHNNANTNAMNPIEFNFSTPSPGGEPSVLAGGPWNVTTTWQDGEIPVDVDVIINGPVTVPEGCVAYANNITFGTEGSLAIAEGGQLLHSNDVEVSFSMQINGYSSKANPEGYYLIAPPTYTDNVELSTPIGETNLFDPGDIYDLYYFDESEALEAGKQWFNHKYTTNNFTDLYLGQGYLFANQGGKAVTWTGNALATTDAIALPLSYTEGKALAGWNLLGNPYTCNVYIGNSEENTMANARPFYLLEGTDLIAQELGSPIPPMKGFFLAADATEEMCYFFTTAPAASKAALNITLDQESAIVDKAIVSFSKGNTLEKFQINPNHTKVYMPVAGKDYAVANIDGAGVMPLNFKAETTGTYTLRFATDGLSLGYLHLIDNFTGANIDLLQEPEYTFKASAMDKENRFRLVFDANSIDNDNFAYQLGDELIVNGNGMLQVYDVMGRFVMSKNVNGMERISTTAISTGVYVLRIVGDEMKTQKIVLK